jgi:hypothetical protein
VYSTGCSSGAGGGGSRQRFPGAGIRRGLDVSLIAWKNQLVCPASWLSSFSGYDPWTLAPGTPKAVLSGYDSRGPAAIIQLDPEPDHHLRPQWTLVDDGADHPIPMGNKIKAGGEIVPALR